MCLFPVTINRNYRKMESRWADAAQRVPCGKCVECLRRRAAQWSFRLAEEMKVSESACFVTLTYADAPISPNGFPTLVKKDFQNFMKRLRKRNHSKIVYYACGEYGSTTHRPHYHAILYNVRYASSIEKAWNYQKENPTGHVDIRLCNLATIRYTCKYLMKDYSTDMSEVDLVTGELIEDDRQKEFALMSKKIGMSYLTPAMYHHHVSKQIGVVTQKGGSIMSLPRYFKDKIFTRSEREALAQEAQAIAELNWEKIYRNAEHEIKYKRDLLRRNQKEMVLKRNKL